MIHPDIELRYIDDIIGYGVFARKFIPEGTITYVKDSLEIEITAEEFQKHDKPMQDIIEKFSFIDSNGSRIVSWDIAKYVNHCCNANTMSTGYGFEMAIRDIQEGEQITDEYGLFNVEYQMELICSQPNCRKAIRTDDFETYHKVWDEKIKKSIEAGLFKVPQPLFQFMDKSVQEEVNELKTDFSRYKSVYHLRVTKQETQA